MTTVDTTPKKILDKLNSGVTVTATDLDVRDLNAVTDNVTAYTGYEGGNLHLLNTDVSGDLQVDVKTMPTTTVQATDLDIRDLTSTERTPLGSNGVSLQQQATTNELKVREQGTLTVSATNLDIRDLTSASDSVEVKQATASNLKAQVTNAAGTGLTNLGYGSSDGGTTWYPIATDTSGHLQVDVLGGLAAVPIGAVLSWLKSYTNTPALPSQFVECNGQVLSDAGSVYNGQTIPNLNGNYFLRGNSTSGGTGGAVSHTHTGPSHTHTFSDTDSDVSTSESSHTHSFSDTSTTGSGGTYGVQATGTVSVKDSSHTHNVSGTTGSGSSHSHTVDISISGTTGAGGTEATGSGSSLPTYYDVVWVMRIK